MRFSSLGWLLLLGWWSCGPAPQVPQQQVPLTALELHAQEGLVYHQGQPFTGLGTEQHSNGQLATRVTYQQGKKHGAYQQWFETGAPSYEGQYEQGKLHGTAKTWWNNGPLRSIARYEQGTPHGLQEQWYRTGERFKCIQLHQGQEQGLQRAWRRNGDLYCNYEVKDGKIYGLKRAALCYELESEQVVYRD